jgi:hypothetical protein
MHRESGFGGAIEIANYRSVTIILPSTKLLQPIDDIEWNSALLDATNSMRRNERHAGISICLGLHCDCARGRGERLGLLLSRAARGVMGAL